MGGLLGCGHWFGLVSIEKSLNVWKLGSTGVIWVWGKNKSVQYVLEEEGNEKIVEDMR